LGEDFLRVPPGAQAIRELKQRQLRSRWEEEGNQGSLFYEFNLDEVVLSKHLLRPQLVRDRGLRTILYLSSSIDCRDCPLKPKCAPKTEHRKLPRDVDGDARELARSLADTPEFEQSSNQRKKVEMVRPSQDPPWI